jgi:hypothetical protein
MSTDILALADKLWRGEATSTMSNGVYRSAANESFGDPFPPSDLERS